MKNYKKYALIALCLCVSVLLNGIYVNGYAVSSASNVKIGSYVTLVHIHRGNQEMIKRLLND